MVVLDGDVVGSAAVSGAVDVVKDLARGEVLAFNPGLGTCPRNKMKSYMMFDFERNKLCRPLSHLGK